MVGRLFALNCIHDSIAYTSASCVPGYLSCSDSFPIYPNDYKYVIAFSSEIKERSSSDGVPIVLKMTAS